MKPKTELHKSEILKDCSICKTPWRTHDWAKHDKLMGKESAGTRTRKSRAGVMPCYKPAPLKPFEDWLDAILSNRLSEATLTEEDRIREVALSEVSLCQAVQDKHRELCPSQIHMTCIKHPNTPQVACPECKGIDEEKLAECIVCKEAKPLYCYGCDGIDESYKELLLLITNRSFYAKEHGMVVLRKDLEDWVKEMRHKRGD